MQWQVPYQYFISGGCFYKKKYRASYNDAFDVMRAASKRSDPWPLRGACVVGGSPTPPPLFTSPCLDEALKSPDLRTLCYRRRDLACMAPTSPAPPLARTPHVTPRPSCNWLKSGCLWHTPRQHRLSDWISHSWQSSTETCNRLHSRWNSISLKAARDR